MVSSRACMFPEYDTGFASLTVKELSSHLQKNSFAFNHCDILKIKVLKHLYYIFGNDL